MSFKISSELQYQVLKDVNEVKMEVDIETKNCEDIVSSCRERPQPCDLYRCVELCVNLNEKKIIGDMWFHCSHSDYNTLEYGITLYDIVCFSVDLDLRLRMEGGGLSLLNKVNGQSEYGGKVEDLIQNSVTKKVSSDASYSIHQDEVDLTDDIVSNSNILISGNIALKFDSNLTTVPHKSLGNFKSLLCEKSFESFENKKNFTIICHGSEFHFNQTLLSMISEVFEKMIQDSNSKEALNSCVEIDDFSPDTIETFQRVAFGSERIKNEDLTSDLLLFAQKYFIMPLVSKCKKNLMDSLTRENIFEIIKVAYLIDDNEMLKTVSKFFSRNKDELKNTEELKDFQKSNPMCMIKVFNFICGFEN